MNEDALDQLSPTQRLLLEIGRTAQLHSRLEDNLRRIHMTLSTPSLAIYLASNIRFEKLVNDTKIMLKKADIPKEVIDTGIKVLNSAKDADKKRHKIVHDLWDEKIDDKEKSQFIKQHLQKNSLNIFKSTKHDISSVRSECDVIVRSFYRTNALNWCLYQTLPFYKTNEVDKSFLKDAIEIMSDNFEINDDGGVTVNKS